MKKYFLNQSGQGLLEMVFAIGIMLIVVAAVLGLATSNIQGQKSTELQVVANNLAREGVEVVRHIRDSNWLAGRQWDTGIPLVVGAIPFLSFGPSGEPIWQLNSIGVAKLYISPEGLYRPFLDPSYTETIFFRNLNIEAICYDGVAEESIKSFCTGSETKIGVKISSKVSWNEKSRARSVTIEDLIYDWR